MKLEEAKKIADEFINPFQTLFYKIEIVGSIRRGKSEVKDIDLIAIPTLEADFNSLLFERYIKKQGEKIITLEYKGIQIDLYLANSENYEVIKLIRTGSAEHNKKLCYLAQQKGWKLKANGEGLIDEKGNLISNREETILKILLGRYIEPKEREK
jgi:DNA polymerase/3'-5' exonuclease PolX